jgi:hypothetical protein
MSADGPHDTQLFSVPLTIMHASLNRDTSGVDPGAVSGGEDRDARYPAEHRASSYTGEDEDTMDFNMDMDMDTGAERAQGLKCAYGGAAPHVVGDDGHGHDGSAISAASLGSSGGFSMSTMSTMLQTPPGSAPDGRGSVGWVKVVGVDVDVDENEGTEEDEGMGIDGGSKRESVDGAIDVDVGGGEGIREEGKRSLLLQSPPEVSVYMAV